MWALIEQLAAAGTTVFLRTQYLEEADHLAQQIVVIDQGRVIANGTPKELKAHIGGERLELTLAQGSDVQAAVHALSPYRSGEIQVDAERHRVLVPVTQGAEHLATIIRDLDALHISLADLALRQPTLDDVFLTLTGHAATGHATEPTKAASAPALTQH
jgi:ABC-2 type transport system ATP-binding protein